MEPYGYIYKVTNKINGKTYIGKTSRNFDERYAYNIGLNSKNKLLKSDIELYGIDNFEIIKQFDVAFSSEELDSLEIKYIKEFHCLETENGYNRMSGGTRGKPTTVLKEELSEAHKGYVMPSEQKRKISEALKGENSPYYGTKHSEDRRKKISESLKEYYSKHDSYAKGRKLTPEQIENMRSKLKGRKQPLDAVQRTADALRGVSKTEEHKKHISEARKGMKFSDEHKKHLSVAKTGKQLSEDHKAKISKSLKGRKTSELQKQKARESSSKKVLCIETGEIYSSGKEAAERYGISPSTIYMCVKNPSKTAAKMHWKYIDE